MPHPRAPIDARAVVDRLLEGAVARQASDVHVEPTPEGYEVRYRIDGLLEPVERLDADLGRGVVARLMVMAGLLTYRLDIPQEGKLAHPQPAQPRPVEMRLAVMPTARGLRAAVRLPAELTQPRSLEELGLPEPVLDGLRSFAAGDAGMLLLTGPAGSGKTTTIYALLGHILQTRPGLSVVTLEDPVERDLPGATQIQVQPFGELTYERALRSILRQDPQVLMLGEVRDAATASIAVQAALSGHRLISTLHAGTPGGAIARLLEMGVEPYQLTSALFGVISQRLLRRTVGDGGPGDGGAGGAGGAGEPGGGGGSAEFRGRYRGRVAVAELALLDAPLRRAVLERADAATLQALLPRQPMYHTIRAAAEDLVARGLTDAEELRRVLGKDEDVNHQDTRSTK